MNILTYTLQLTDRMSSTLSRIGVSTGSTTQDVRELKGEVQSLNNVNLNGFFSTMKKISAFLGIGALFGKSIKDGMEQGMKNVSFEVLFGGEEPAKRMIDNVTEYAAKAYGQTAVTNAVQMMKGFDIETDEIMKNIRAIGDISMGKAEKFNSLTLAFSQMSSTGKLMGQDLLQMINAGFNPLIQMSEKTGKSVIQLKDDMSKGLITAEMVKQVFYDVTDAGGQYYGMIDKISNTAGGQWKNAMSNFNLRLLDLYNIIEPYLIPALKKLNTFLSDPIGTIGRLLDKITTAYPIISAVIIGLMAAFTAYKGVVGVLAIKVAFLAAKQWLLNAALAASPIGLIIIGMTALISLIGFLIFKIDGWKETWNNAIKFCTLTLDGFKTSIQLKWLQIQNFFMKGLETIEKGWYKLQSLWNEDAANAGLAKLESQRSERAKEIAAAQEKIKDINNQIANLDVIQLKVNDTSFSDVANGIKNKLGIATPGVPGTNGSGVAGTGGLMGGGTGSNAGKDTANSIATGGSKTTHITINLGELVGSININKNGFRESAENMRDIVLDEMTRVLSMAQGQTI